jgi:glycosyltransferase XagB
VTQRQPRSPVGATSLRPSGVLSAKASLSPRQRLAALGILVLVVVGLIVDGHTTVVTLLGIVALFYLATLLFRLLAMERAFRGPALIRISDAEARAVPASQLPMYTVLVPAYREAEEIAPLLDALKALDYPEAKLDIKLLLEADDTPTIAAAKGLRRSCVTEIVRVPDSPPRTKPKACNYGLRTAMGELLTIYDAEDQPEPLQLRRAALAFRRVAPDVACLQARLAYHNPNQNLLTRWFAAEYALWFERLLPGLVSLDAPLPLGGTSCHFRRATLEEVGGWDAYNVTEDADLGIRLHRLGYRTRVLDSTTLEEANSDFVNWVKQRSRWYKGYLQTCLVHLRQPRQLLDALGWRGVAAFVLFVAGTPLLALLNPIFWALTALWFVAHPAFIVALFPPWIYYPSLFCLGFGNFVFLYSALVGARDSGNPQIVLASLGAPVYWAMMSLAAVKALVQLVSAPSFWEKTVHGLDRAAAAHPTASTDGNLRF